jgi:hypothetical protein
VIHKQASCININDHDLYHQTQSEVLMPTSWPKDEAGLAQHCLLCFTTLPSQQSHTSVDSPAWSTHPLQQKRLLFSAFLHGEVFLAFTTTPSFSIASCLGAFYGPVSQKRIFSSFHTFCLAVISTFSPQH